MIPLPQTKTSLETKLKAQAKHLGFQLVGIAPATEADGFERLQQWLDHDFAGEMTYMHKQREARRHPRSILESVRSVIMVGMNYSSANSGTKQRSRNQDGELHKPIRNIPFPGQVASYAQGKDYHEVLWDKLNQLLDWLQEQRSDCVGRGVVDTAPLLERDFARRAGLGWIGKNTMLINRKRGSFFFLGALLTNLDLQPDQPHETSHCGSCTACLQACPTQAFVGPGWLDARQCISYLTIEHRSQIPEALRSRIENWLFGCDVCQDVCPWNRKPIEDVSFPHQTDLEQLDLIELLGLDENQFRERFRQTPLLRTKRRGLLRNAAIVLGNIGDERAVAVLQNAINDPEPLIQEAAQWAIKQIQRRRSSSESIL